MTGRTDGDPGRSFTDPGTEFLLKRSQTPVDVDGYKKGELTGEVECMECGASAGNIDAICHDKTCPQRDVFSEWWRGTHENSYRSD